MNIPKYELQDVQIEFQGKVYNGRISGYLMDYPFVYIPGTDLRFQFSWNTLINAAKYNQILKAN